MNKLILMILVIGLITTVSAIEIQATNQGISTQRIVSLDSISNAVNTFLGLLDTPVSYSGQGGDCVKVNVGETGLEFGDCGNGTGGGGGGNPFDQSLNKTDSPDYHSLTLNGTLSFDNATADSSNFIVLLNNVSESFQLAMLNPPLNYALLRNTIGGLRFETITSANWIQWDVISGLMTLSSSNQTIIINDSVNSTGKVCDSVGCIGDVTDTSGNYIYNDSTTIFSNDTKLNDHFNETAELSAINKTANIESLNFTQGDHTIQSNETDLINTVNKTANIESLNFTQGDHTPPADFTNVAFTNETQAFSQEQNFTNITVEDIIFIEDKDHTLRRGSDFFNSLADDAIVLEHKDTLSFGSIGVMFTNNERLMFATQVGRNRSASILGNSWMVVPNNLTDNMTLYSDCQFVANELGAILFADCDTVGTGADFIVQDDIQSLFGAAFVNGIRSRGFANFIMDGDDFDIFNGTLHARTPRIEEVGFDIGDQIITINQDFDSGLLNPFKQITSGGGSAEWIVVSDAQCHEGECAVAQGGTGSPVRTMEANFTTTNMESLVLQFFLTTEGMAGGDLLNITVNNNTGSGLVEIFSIVNGPDETDTYNASAIPAEMENITSVSIRISFSATNPVNTFAWIDNIIVNGTASINTLANVTRLDTTILLGDGSQSMFWNATSKVLQLPGNTTFISESVVDLNVTGGIELNGTTITDFGQINANSSDFWDDLDIFNSTQMENIGGILNIKLSWLTTFINDFGFLNQDVYINDSELPLANRTLPYCGNITGAASDLCTITGGAGGGGLFEDSAGWINNQTAIGLNITNLTITLGNYLFFGLPEIGSTGEFIRAFGNDLEFHSGQDLEFYRMGTLFFDINTDGITIGSGVAGKNYQTRYDGEDNDYFEMWMEDEDYLDISDDILMSLAENIFFGDTEINISSPSDGNYHMAADGNISFATTRFCLNPTCTLYYNASGTLCADISGTCDRFQDMLGTNWVMQG